MNKGPQLLLSLFICLTSSASYADTLWIEHETNDPFGADFLFIAMADSIVSDQTKGYAPQGIYIECEKQRLFVGVGLTGNVSYGNVRYKFDNKELVQTGWQTNFDGSVVYPSGLSPYFGTQLEEDNEKSPREIFLSELEIGKTLIFEVSSDFGDDGGHATFSDLTAPTPEFWKRIKSCKND